MNTLITQDDTVNAFQRKLQLCNVLFWQVSFHKNLVPAMKQKLT